MCSISSPLLHRVFSSFLVSWHDRATQNSETLRASEE
jgi:hypothetical protein